MHLGPLAGHLNSPKQTGIFQTKTVRDRGVGGFMVRCLGYCSLQKLRPVASAWTLVETPSRSYPMLLLSLLKLATAVPGPNWASMRYASQLNQLISRNCHQPHCCWSILMSWYLGEQECLRFESLLMKLQHELSKLELPPRPTQSWAKSDRNGMNQTHLVSVGL